MATAPKKNSSFSSWINPSAQNAFATAAAKYKAMGTNTAVTQAATKAAGVVRTAAQKIITSDDSLAPYVSVAKQIKVWSDDQGVYVGVQPSSTVYAMAQALDAFYPVIETALDMTQSQIMPAFYDALDKIKFTATIPESSAQEAPINETAPPAQGDNSGL